ncbi:hypothetical protein HBI39_113120 [Parastagonospora nodorum]|nr:hypothetical protein HBI79_067080 [Parastagonospora nodorum]KAH5432526.1 hypothetical protein HBI47_093020 [Parastagonospora nodorum]KAH6304553.1 hypothetical protein HBI39_113120 [Parastagonospora nodorum]
MPAKYAAVKAQLEYTVWVEEELIPLLIDAYGKPARYWRQAAKNAEQSVDKLPVYEDFDSTVERIRLLLINKDILTRAEIKDFGWIRTKWPWCVGVLVRHALNHGPYPLATLDKEPHPDHVRQKVKKPEDQDIYVYCGRLAIDDDVRPEDSFKHKKKKTRKSHWRQSDKQSEHDAFEPMKSPQNDTQEHTVDEAVSKKELTSVPERLGVTGVENRPASELGGNLPVPVHQLPPRPQFGNHGLIDPSHSKKNARLRVYPQWGIRPMLEHSEQSSYIPNHGGFPNGPVSQPYMYGNSISNNMGRGGFPAPPHQPGPFGQPFQHNGMPSQVLGNQSFPPPYQYDAYGQSYREYGADIPAPHQVNGSFHAPYQHSTPVPPTPSYALANQGMPAMSSEYHLRFEADEFVPEFQGRRF